MNSIECILYSFFCVQFCCVWKNISFMHNGVILGFDDGRFHASVVSMVFFFSLYLIGLWNALVPAVSVCAMVQMHSMWFWKKNVNKRCQYTHIYRLDHSSTHMIRSFMYLYENLWWSKYAVMYSPFLSFILCIRRCFFNKWRSNLCVLFVFEQFACVFIFIRLISWQLPSLSFNFFLVFLSAML
jgi:hypothetical protein